MNQKRFSPACERNQQPILDQLTRIMTPGGRVLEIGSGTGQHATFFGEHLADVSWQTSDLAANHASINAWRDDAGLDNVLPPLDLDVLRPGWQQHLGPFDYIFTANTAHIMSWPAVEAAIRGAGECLRPGGGMLIYGPFNYDGCFTSDSNQRFDASLRAENPHMGIRDFEAVCATAGEVGLLAVEDVAMPANNRLLVFKRDAGTV